MDVSPKTNISEPKLEALITTHKKSSVTFADSWVVGQFDAVAAIPHGGIAKWRRKAASTSN
jgi:hypothetical protein